MICGVFFSDTRTLVAQSYYRRFNQLTGIVAIGRRLWFLSVSRNTRQASFANECQGQHAVLPNLF